MEDFSTIIYVILGIIFVVGRIIKASKSSPNTPRRPQRRPSKPAGQSETQTFEDILKEFGQKVDRDVRPPSPPDAPRETPGQAERESVKRFAREGEERRFADDESKRIYEEAIVRSEGFDIEFGEDSHFKSKRTIFGSGAVKIDKKKKNPIAAELRKDLKSREGIRKAVILGEIFKRKY